MAKAKTNTSSPQIEELMAKKSGALSKAKALLRAFRECAADFERIYSELAD
jgi:hypothetical protein